MGNLRWRSVMTLIFVCYAASCLDSSSSSSSGQVGGGYRDSDDIKMFCTSNQYIMQSYFSTHNSLTDADFRDFLIGKQQSCEIPLEDSNVAAPAIALLRRNLTGEGSHRHLLTSIPLPSLSQPHELVIIERLPLGVFADPFELQNLQQSRVFSDIAVFGDTNLELPSFRSNRSVVEIHFDIGSTDHGIELRLPLHARYQALEDSGYSRVEFGEPDVFVCQRREPDSRNEQMRCLHLSGGRSKTEMESVVVWEIPAGIRHHTKIVSVMTFVAAVFSALAIVFASAFSSKHS